MENPHITKITSLEPRTFPSTPPKHRIYLLVFSIYLLLLLVCVPAMGQSVEQCPSTSDLGSGRLICTSGSYDNPYRDTGLVSSIHALQGGYLRLGPATYDTNGFGASYTFLYHVDTAQSNILLVTNITNYQYPYPHNLDSLPYFRIQLLDSLGNLIDSCHHLQFSFYDTHGTTSNGNGRLTYTTPSRIYAFDLRPLHNQTVRLHLTAGKPPALLTRNVNRCTFSCIHIDTLILNSNCSRGVYYTAPLGFDYAWTPLGQPDSVVSTARTFSPGDYHRYTCRLYSFVNPQCVIDTLITPSITQSQSTGQFSATLLDTLQGDTLCQVRYRLEKDFTSYTYSDTATHITYHDTLVPHYWILDGQTLPPSTSIINLLPGNHTITLRFRRTEQCTTQVSKNIYVDICACHYYDSLYSSCPSVHDLYSPRVQCSYGTWGSTNSTFQGIVADRHAIITTPGYDPYTGGYLPVIPPGENASIRLGNNRTGSHWESATFIYRVDSNLADLLILRYAAVLENPNHTSDNQPKFTFRVLDQAGNDINASCYSAEFVSSTSLGWYTGTSNSILWKDWTTVGVDLLPLHGQTISIQLTTYDCSQGAHFGYAYFTLGCASKQILSDFCGDNFSFTAPEGFSYQWYPTGDSSSILSSDRQFTTTYSGQYTCRMGFIGAPAGSNCYNTLNVETTVRYPYASFSLDTLDTLDTPPCAIRFRLTNNSYQVTTLDANNHVYDTSPANNSHFLVDGVPYPAGSLDTLLLAPGPHTISVVASIDEGVCTDTATLDLLVQPPCHCPDTITDTLFLCKKETPYPLIDTLFVTDTILDSLYTIIHTVDHPLGIDTTFLFHIFVATNIEITYAETLVENDLPYTAFGITLPSLSACSPHPETPPTFDTSFILLGRPPECDTTLTLHITVYPNLSDTAWLFICPNQIPFHINDSTTLTNRDTTITYRGMHGEDSTVHYGVHILHDTDTAIADTILERQLPWVFLDSLFYDTANRIPFILVNEQGCDSTIHYSLYIYWDGDHCDTTLTFPNVVTPNGDGLNDKFIIGGLLENNCFKFNDLVIYDRTGHLVYQAHNIAKEEDWWDPAAHRHPAGTYFYIFKAHGVTIHTLHQGVIEVMK